MEDSTPPDIEPVAAGYSPAKPDARERILNFFVRSGLVPKVRIQDFRNLPDAPERLVSEGLVTPADLARAKANISGLAFRESLDGVQIPEETARRIPEKKLRRYGAVPVSGGDGETVFAVHEPSAFYALEDLRILAGGTASFIVAPKPEVNAALDRLFSDSGETPPRQESADPSTVELLDALLERAITDGASDIHLEPSEGTMKVRLRVDGVLKDEAPVTAGISGTLVTRIKVLAGLDIAERRVPQDGRFTFDSGGDPVDLRVATLPTTHGESVVVRLLNRRSVALDLSRLGFFKRDLAAYEKVISRSGGTILVTGPTGSGKSTTLYATLMKLNSSEKKIVTIEDPVEYRLPGLTQVQVHPRAGLTFASGLRSILRADPDILMVGEIRDHETARTAIEAALTGHLVFATLHTNDAPSALTRLMDMGIEPYLIASSVNFVVAQRLARRLCESCRKPAPDAPAILHESGLPTDLSPRDPTLFVPEGCDSCGGTGYKGRIGVYEMLPLTEEISSRVAARAPATEISRLAEAAGMLRLRTDGLRKAALGLTSIEEILRSTV